MSSTAPVKITVRLKAPDAFGLHSITADPRVVTPYDVRAACSNMIYASPDGDDELDLPVEVFSCLEFILKDYFELAHRSGLYNRQRPLWSSLSKVVAGEVSRLSKGVFFKKELPAYEIVLFNSQQQPLVVCHLALPEDSGEAADVHAGLKPQDYLTQLVTRLNRLQTRWSTVAGAFLCLPEPFDEAVLAKVRSMVNADDPVGHFDSVLPSPAATTLNLIELSGECKQVLKPLDRSEHVAAVRAGGESAPAQRESEDACGLQPREVFVVKLVHPSLPERKAAISG